MRDDKSPNELSCPRAMNSIEHKSPSKHFLHLRHMSLIGCIFAIEEAKERGRRFVSIAAIHSIEIHSRKYDSTIQDILK